MHIRSVFLSIAACLLAACTAAAPSAASKPVAEQPAPVPVVEPVRAPAPSLVPKDFIVSTNEPFWQARVEGDILVLAGPGGERRYAVEMNKPTRNGRHVLARDPKGVLDVQVTAQACEDDMSGAAFPFSGSLSFDGGDSIRGCARPASQPPSGEKS